MKYYFIIIFENCYGMKLFDCIEAASKRYKLKKQNRDFVNMAHGNDDM